jgi:ribosomal subunit interface protein
MSDSLRSYAEKRLQKLERQLADPTIELELTAERNPSITAHHVAEATVWSKGPVLRARESAHDVRASIDQLVDKLEAQASRNRDKRNTRRRGRGLREPEAPAEPESGLGAPPFGH